MLTRSQFIKLLGVSVAGVMVLPSKIKTFTRQEPFSKLLFGKKFTWGVATGAYQIEGAWNTDGKGLSIWDSFTHKKGKIKDHSTGDIACDFYHKYPEDLQLLKNLHFDAFRFSVSWPRVLPNGTGAVNQKGIDFYNRVIDTCLEKGINPWLNLYHWDLPLELEKKGGWTNRSIVDWFGEYTNICTSHFGDRVKNWLVLNEPMAFTSLGYFAGIHAPGHRGLNKFLSAVHHAALCQSTGGAIIRQNVPGAHIGTTFSCSYIDPKKSKPRFFRASKRLDALLNRLFIEPTLGMGYPYDALPFLKRIERFMQPGDEEKLKFDFDFIGLQNYFRVIGKPSLIPFVWANRDNPNEQEALLTDMGWEVYPDGIYKVIKRFAQYPIKEFVISENGAAFTDKVIDGGVHDIHRTEYFRHYLEKVLQAKNEGINISGYFAWTFVDNFEWAQGNHVRFGIVYNDFQTQRRLIKDSGYWFQSFLTE
jgi:beta-glucosidase